MKISFYFVIHKIIAYAGRLHFDFCGHCGRDTGYFSGSLAHIPQEKLTPRPRRDPGLFLCSTFLHHCKPQGNPSPQIFGYGLWIETIMHVILLNRKIIPINFTVSCAGYTIKMVRLTM
jgi:hypothetical protein